MAKNDFTRQLHLAAVLLTRLPLPRLDPAAFAQSAQAVWAYPLIGVGLGALGLAVGLAGLWLGLPSGVSAGLVIAAMLGLSGAMHEDGLADVADGFWGAGAPPRRLEIMRDSQIGSYGTLALIVAVGLRWSAYTMALVLMPLALIAAAALSRGMMPWAMARMPHARQDGLARSVGTVEERPAVWAAGLGGLVAVALCGFGGALAILAAMASSLAVMTLAERKIGGQTGDVLGAIQQISEIAALLVLIALL